MPRIARLLILTALVAGASSPATAADPSSVDALSVAGSGTTLVVSGTATFKDVPVEIGTDAPGDASMPGTDLTKATIYSPQNNRLRFRLDIADAMPAVSSTPAGVYLWPLTIDDNNTGLSLHASRARVGVLPSDPHLRLVRIAGGNITTVAQLTGTMANGIVEAEVLLSQLGASGGSTITSEGVINVIPGISGVGTLNGADYDNMFGEVSYTVPSRVVRIGVGPAGAPASSIPLTGTATVTSTGSFTGSLPAPTTPGDYQVVAQACYGPQSCGTSTVEFSQA